MNWNYPIHVMWIQMFAFLCCSFLVYICYLIRRHSHSVKITVLIIYSTFLLLGLIMAPGTIFLPFSYFSIFIVFTVISEILLFYLLRKSEPLYRYSIIIMLLVMSYFVASFWRITL